jgi:hypothetical protein
VWLVTAGPLEAATLSWDRNPEPTVTGYRISYGTQPGARSTTLDVGNVITYALNPPSGQQYFIVVQAFDGTTYGPESNEVVLDLRITPPPNQPPTLNQPPNQSGFVGSAASLALSGSDPENSPLTYSATGLPAGLTLNSSTGAISGTLQTAATYNVTATVSDGSLTASRSFTWIVSTQTTTEPRPPAPPADTTLPTVSFASPTNNETLNGKKIQLKANASDASGIRSVRYLLDGNTLSGDITVAPYQYAWDVSGVAAGAHQLTARATDNAGNVGTQTITVTIKAGNGKNTVDTAINSVIPDDGDPQSDADASAARRPGDVAITGDFDGDGIADPGAFTSGTGEWRLWLSSNRYAASAAMVWGAENDVPVPADYDGDGRTDLAVFRPASGTWSIVASNNGTPSRLDVGFGREGDQPIAFDYDRDGRADLALKRPGGFDILLSSTNYASSISVR